jgi:hypothetical protein
MEIGRQAPSAKTWLLGNDRIKSVPEYKYLRDIIMKNGKNARNIDARFKKIKSSTYNIITCASSDIMKTTVMRFKHSNEI